MRVLTPLVFALLIWAGCTGQSSSTPVPPSPAPEPSPIATPSPTPVPLPTNTPEPSPTFDPGRVILPTVAIPTPSPEPADPLSETLDAIISRTVMLRGLFSLGPIDREFITREEHRVLLREDLEEDRDDIDMAQELYVPLGILGRDESYFDLLLDIYGEDVLGLYDTEEQKLYVIQDNPEFNPEDERTYAHEYVHGLQQQHFDIRSIRESLEDHSDRSRAFVALREGDATLSHTLYTVQFMDEDAIAALREAGLNAVPGAFEAAPHVIQRTIIFPYFEGPRFVVRLFLVFNNWDAVDQAYEDLPQSTEHILHPEKYLSGEEPIVVELPDLSSALGESWTELRRDTLGEFLILAYLETDLPPGRASTAAEGWGGDNYVLFKGPEDDNLLVSLIAWDSEGDAQEFFDTFLDFMQTRTGAAWEMAGGDGSGQIMHLPDQSILLSLDADRTLLIFAPDAETLEIVRMALQGS